MTDFPPFRLDRENRCVWACRSDGTNSRLALPPRADDMLQYLINHASRLIMHEEFFDALWQHVYVQPDADANSQRSRYAAVPILLLLIESFLAVNQCDEAAEVLAMLLRQAAKAGMHQTLVDYKECIAQLIVAVVLGERMAVEDEREFLPYVRMLMKQRHQRNADTEALKSNAGRDTARLVSTPDLSERERVIIGLMGGGLTNKQIAIRLRIAPETVKSYAKHLYVKLGARNRTEAAMLANRLGLIRLSGSDVG
jgi:DNA-binding NarL/FixJ family response regulator